MATITIGAQVLDGNLGDYWNNDYETAKALANYTENVWRNDLVEFVSAGHDVEINIDVQKNTTGVSRGIIVDTDITDMGEAYELLERVNLALTDENRIWEMFCASDEAAEYC
jgi:hypothetical protein